MQDEQMLVTKAQAGDDQALGELYELYFERIYNYIALKIGDRTEAEDLAEQVFLKMIESLANFRWQGATFASWLFRIAHNLIVDHLRRKTRRPAVSIEDVILFTSAEDDPHNLLEAKISREELATAISRLTELQGQVIMLKFGAGLSNAEVGTLLGRSEGAIKSLQFSALQNLQKLLTNAAPLNRPSKVEPPGSNARAKV